MSDHGPMSAPWHVSNVRLVTVRRELGSGLRPPLLHRATPAQLQAIDVALAALVALVGLVHSRRSGIFVSPLATVASTGAYLSAAAVLLRRRSPLAALVLGVVAVVTAFTSPIAAVSDLSIGLPVYSLAASWPRPRAVPALAGALAVLMVTTLAAAAGGRHQAGSPFAAVLVSLAVWAVSDSLRVRRVYLAGIAEQAAQRESEALQRAERSVAEERLEIARELHDVVAHSLSVIALQSGVGRHVLDDNPAAAKRALAAVEETSRGALDELRRMLGILRRPDDAAAGRAPAPGADQLPRLVEQVRQSGVAVELRVETPLVARLTPGAGLSVYRIAQEALTNVVRHAPGAGALVVLSEEAGALVLEVVDDGRKQEGAAAEPVGVDAPPAAHHGLVGMRERVTLFGGEFSAGARGSGFAVVARFPLARVLAP